MLIETIDWAAANAGKGYWTHMDACRVGVAGDITGIETILLSSITKPIFYILGGPADIVCKYGEADYKNLLSTTTAWKGNLPTSHARTYNEVNGGKIGVATSY
ncbi:hypothetical protein BDZ45DRAFT_749252 [Acephala macrosclerotiorum]|nr:hypothetical protein BDZ45DRAFT_749252 [Acephala macrosclerotiorum]